MSHFLIRTAQVILSLTIFAALVTEDYDNLMFFIVTIGVLELFVISSSIKERDGK